MGAPESEPTGAVVTVQWHDVDTGGDDALRAHVADVLGVDPEEVSVGRLCGRCGSSDHGRPWAGHDVHVSLARSGPHLVTAVSTAGPVGVDVEEVAAGERAARDVAALEGWDDADAATRWCRLEAVGKLAGTGLDAPRSAVLPDGVTVVDVDAPEGYRAALAVGD